MRVHTAAAVPAAVSNVLIQTDGALVPPPAALTLTMGTVSMRRYVHNWLMHAARVPALRPYYAVALDAALHELCLAWQQPVLDALPLLVGDAPAVNATFRLRHMRGYLRNERAGFKVFGFIKGRLVARLLRQGYDVLLADADSVFLGNPWPWIGRASLLDTTRSNDAGRHVAVDTAVGGARASQPRSDSLASDAGQLPAADVLISNDYPDLRRDGQPDSVYNSGLLVLRSTWRAILFGGEWAERTQRTGEIGNDQTELNRLLRGRYKDGEWGCNHDGCLERDQLLFVPTAAVFAGAGCPPGSASERLSKLRDRAGADATQRAAGAEEEDGRRGRRVPNQLWLAGSPR